MKTLKTLGLLTFFSVITLISPINEAKAVALPSMKVTRTTGSVADFSVVNPLGAEPGDLDYLTSSKVKIRTKEFDKFITYLKVDISGLKDLYSINSASMTLRGLGEGSISAYYVSNDIWVDENANREFADMSVDNAIANVVLNDWENENDYVFNLNDDGLAKLINDVRTSGDNYFSLALKADNAYDTAIFNSKEALSGQPEFRVNGEAPVPEPSTAVLGLMGIGSLLGIRRKK